MRVFKNQATLVIVLSCVSCEMNMNILRVPLTKVAETLKYSTHI